MDMSKGFALLLVLIFLMTSCTMISKPVSGQSAGGDSWVEKAPMPTARGGLGVAVVDNKIYAIGGSTEVIDLDESKGGGVVGTNEEYDPATDVWTSRAPMPTPSSYFSTAVFQDKIYCISGGLNEVYDPATDTWETKTPMPTDRSGLQANVVNGKIYCIGGMNSDGNITGINEAYDPATDTWTTKAPMPNATTNYASTVFNNKIYIIGGNTIFQLTQIYDPQTDNWSLGTPPPEFGTGIAVATVGIMAPERIYVFAGWNSMFGGGTTEIYNPESNTWTSGADIPTGRTDFGVADIDDTLYVIGGTVEVFPFPFDDPGPENANPTSVNEQYTPAGFGTPDPKYLLETTPPKISLLSPLNQTYNESSISLVFSADKMLVGWVTASMGSKT